MTGRTTCAIILIMFAIEFINAQMIYNVTVGPDSKTRQAVPIDIGPCDAMLNIRPESPWKLGSSHITSQDDNLWSAGSKVATTHTYNMVNAYSSREYVHIHGKLTQNGSGEEPPPPFDVTVPAVDIDWVGCEAKTDEGASGQEVEFHNKVACQITTNHNEMREFIVRPPFDDYSMFQNTATLRMTFNSSLILVYDNLDNPVNNGKYLSFSKSAAAKTFHMSPKDNATAGQEFFIYVEGVAGGDGYKPRDAIRGVVVKVDLDIGNIADADEETTGGFVPVNADNDNGSIVTDHIPTTRDFNIDGYTDDDLVPISLSLEPTTGLSGTLRLRKIEGGRGRIKIWETTGKLKEVTLSQTWTVGTDTIPTTLQVEGLKESQALREIDLVLEYQERNTVVCSDMVKVTVTPVLKNLTAVACTHVPDYHVDKDMLEMLWSNGGWGTPTMSIAATVWNITNPAGKLNIIQHVCNQGFLASGAGAINSNGAKWKWDFASPYGGATLVDGFGTGATWDPFYADYNSSAIMFESEDTPRVWVGPVEILPGLGKSTAIDIKQNFIVYAAWQLSDDTVYFLGSAMWNIRYQGTLTNAAGSITFTGGANNKATGSSGFSRDNANQTTGEPGATDEIAPWRWP